MLDKLLKGSALRKSRLHDHRGHVVPLNRLVANGPRAAASGLLRVTLGFRPQRPWISYSATQELAAFLDQDKAVLEFGSGMSTLWYAKHAGKVVSIENYRPWYDHVSDLLVKNNVQNVEYRYGAQDDDYARIPDGHSGFDLIMVDGGIRDRCTSASLDMLRPGGIFYLDNSDRMAFSQSGEARAGEIALAYAKKHDCSVTYFTDFAPTQFFVQEGMMLRRPI